jgi:hypothetical protein
MYMAQIILYNQQTIPSLGNEGTVASRYVIVSSPWKNRELRAGPKKEEITGE